MSQRCLWQLAWHAGLFGSLITEGRPEAMDYALERLQDTEHMLGCDRIDKPGPDGLVVGGEGHPIHPDAWHYAS
jgi:hypothetical protein